MLWWNRTFIVVSKYLSPSMQSIFIYIFLIHSCIYIIYIYYLLYILFVNSFFISYLLFYFIYFLNSFLFLQQAYSVTTPFLTTDHI